MSQKIDGNLPAAATVRSSVSGRVASAGSQISATSPSDSLSLTGEATNLQTLQRNLSKAPAVDSSRVQAVKDSLQSGSYKVNADTISSRLQDMEQRLGG